ncbi:MAG TPA: extracellular solute-binding protein [Limnochordales bacterium]
MARRTWRRLLVVALGALALAGLALGAWWVRFGHRFDAAGRTIDPRARIDPQRRYELVVWDEAIVVPWAAEAHGDVLAQAVAEFRERWPNVQVRFSLLDSVHAREQLAAAVAAGRPPDVYGTVRGLVVYPSHQIPATPYLPAVPRDEPPYFQPAALAGLSYNGAIWGWPRGMWWDVWLADAALLARAGLDIERVLAQGWTWRELAEAAGRLAGAVDAMLVLDTTSVATLEHLMLNAGAVGYLDAAGAGWSQTALAQVAGALRRLVEQGAIPANHPAASRTRVERLLQHRAAVIGPVGPTLLRTVLQRQPERFTPVPVPHIEDARMAAPMEPGGYFVFRQDAYQGDDHIRLAMELAQWLAGRTEAWLAETLGVLPARTDALHAWHQVAPLNDRSKAFLAGYLQHARAHGPSLPAETVASLRARVAPHWHGFWAGSLAPEPFAAAVRRELEQAVAPRAGQP